MSTTQFDRAIFTSVRTPMGEGYRIIAASAGIRPEEKQAITRSSPSHNSLCAEQPAAQDEASLIPATAFYPLPTGRLCVAYSCLAGAEHTARGGLRVYTHSLIFSEDDFPEWGCNPFAILRAMVHNGMAEPQLKPPSMLERIELSPGDGDALRRTQACCSVLAGGCGRTVLEQALNGQRVLLNLESGWVDTAEALMLGVPAQRRAAISIDAGMQFSTSRAHVISVLFDPKQQTKRRLVGQPITYIDADGDAPPQDRPSQWLTFVDRCWRQADPEALARRTNGRFSDVSAPGLERVGTLFNEMDALASKAFAEVIGTIRRFASQLLESPERELVGQLVDEARDRAIHLIPASPWPVLAETWPQLVAMLHGCPPLASVALTIAEGMLEAALRHDPIAAVTATIELASRSGEHGGRAETLELIEHTMQAVTRWAESMAPTEVDRLRSACVFWSKAGCTLASIKHLASIAEARSAPTPT